MSRGRVPPVGQPVLRRLPDFPGNFDGEVMHVQSCRAPDRPTSVRGKRVVVGTGNTGCELACEIAEAGAATSSSLE
ncbi:MAG: hypothetical protein P8R42_08120 [Candidatus Binatia bacterium]|nr:hypothetical protein [Candidatus Binatia bacterium]